MKKLVFIVTLLLVCCTGTFAQNDAPVQQNANRPPAGNSSISLSSDSLPDAVSDYHQEISDVKIVVDSLTNKSDRYFEWEKHPNWEKINFWTSNPIALFSFIVGIISIVVMYNVYKKTRKDMNDQIQEQHNDTNNQINNQRELSRKQLLVIGTAAKKRDDSLTKIGTKIDKSVERITTVIAGKNDYDLITSSLCNIKVSQESLIPKIADDFMFFSGDMSNYQIYLSSIKDIKLDVEKNQRVLTDNGIDFSKKSDDYKNALDILLNKTDQDEQLEQIENCENAYKEYCGGLNEILNSMKDKFNN